MRESRKDWLVILQRSGGGGGGGLCAFSYLGQNERGREAQRMGCYLTGRGRGLGGEGF